jgi:hypothetical protein
MAFLIVVAAGVVDREKDHGRARLDSEVGTSRFNSYTEGQST